MDTKKSKNEVLKHLVSTPVVQVACKKAGVSRATYYRWCKSDKNFKKQAEEALREGIGLINDLAESKLITNINEQNMTAIIYWLKNHHPDYKEKLEISAKSDNVSLSKEQREIIQKAVELSPLKINQNSNEKDK